MSGRIEDPIAYSEGYGHISRTGKKAVTEWELVGSSVCALFLKLSKISLPIGQPNVPLSLLRLKLLTGNKHQLRIHLAERLGGWFVHFLESFRPHTIFIIAPILGDSAYSTRELNISLVEATMVPNNRIFLHASEVSFFVGTLVLFFFFG